MSRKDNKYDNGDKDREVPTVSEASAIYRVGGYASRPQDDLYQAEAEALYADLEAAMDRILARTRDIKSEITSLRNEIAATAIRG